MQFAHGGFFPEISYMSGKSTISTLVDSGRNANGNLIGQVIGNDKHKYEVNFKYLAAEDWRRFLSNFDRDQGGLFINEFVVYDMAKGQFVTKTCYVGDRSGTPFKTLDGIPETYRDAQANLIEV